MLKGPGRVERKRGKEKEREGYGYVLACLSSFQMDHFHPFKTLKKEQGVRAKREENSKPSVDRIKAAL